MFCTVTYQGGLNQKNDSWHCFHIVFDDFMYEKCHDFKRVFKITVSKLFSLAIEFLLNKQVKEVMMYNYTRNFIILHKRYKDLCLTITICGKIPMNEINLLMEMHSMKYYY